MGTTTNPAVNVNEVSEHTVEIITNSGEGAQKCAQIFGAVCAKMGYQMFDSALPTRDARRGRLYTFTGPSGLGGTWFRFLYIHDKQHIRAADPVSEFCDCEACTHYSRGYLHHLFKLQDHLFYRLATIHNLRFMRLLEDRMRTAYG